MLSNGSTRQALAASPCDARVSNPATSLQQAERLLDMRLVGDGAACQQVAAWIIDLIDTPIGRALLWQMRRYAARFPGAELHIIDDPAAPAAAPVPARPPARSWALRLPVLTHTPDGRMRTRQQAVLALFVALNGLLEECAIAEGGDRDERPLAWKVRDFLPVLMDCAEDARNRYWRAVPRAGRVACAPFAEAWAIAAAGAAAAAAAGAAAGAAAAAAVRSADGLACPGFMQATLAQSANIQKARAIGNEVVRRLTQVPAGLQLVCEIEARQAEIRALHDTDAHFIAEPEIGLAPADAQVIALFEFLSQMLAQAQNQPGVPELADAFAGIRPTMQDFRAQLGCPVDPRELALRQWEAELNFDPRAVGVARELRHTLAAGGAPPDPILLGLPALPAMLAPWAGRGQYGAARTMERAVVADAI